MDEDFLEQDNQEHCILASVNVCTLVPEAIYKEEAMERGRRGRGTKRGRGKIASGRIHWKSHFHAKPKYRN